ncbi:hypothetical protein SAMN05661012_04170 [Chitinophaga sancti]|uniref:Uncharacterized protein n=1 Tax=Chitinophaga sancti TaxID=1004 RepID=A0A1K1RT98_9BACT|nr:hypothetical protein SAMN05661012_04170 [Chitinophaga sancti]
MKSFLGFVYTILIFSNLAKGQAHDTLSVRIIWIKNLKEFTLLGAVTSYDMKVAMHFIPGDSRNPCTCIFPNWYCLEHLGNCHPEVL